MESISRFIASSAFGLLRRGCSEGVAVILAFIGVKLIIQRWVEVSTVVSLGTISIVFILSIGASLILSKMEGKGFAGLLVWLGQPIQTHC